MVEIFRKKNICEGCETEDPNEAYAKATLKDQLWGHFLQQKKIVINEIVTDHLIEKAIMQIYQFNEIDDAMFAQDDRYRPQPIKVFINTLGGDGDIAMSFASAVATSKTPVHTIALGRAMSAGFIMLLAGHRRFCQPYSLLMHHQGSSGIAGEFKSIQDFSTFCDNYQNIIDAYVIKQTKIKTKKLKEVFNHKQDWYIHSQEALELGIVHEIYR